MHKIETADDVDFFMTFFEGGDALGEVPGDTLAEDTDLTLAIGRTGRRVVYAEDARAWTEAPSSLGDLWRQRYRWSYGTMQAVWKHKGAMLTRDPRELLTTYVAAIRANMLTYSIWAGNYALVVPKQHRHVLTAAGFTKKDIREFVFDGARVTRREWRSVGKAAVAGRKDEDAVYTALRSPDDLLVVAAGGPAGGFGVIVPPWYGAKALAVTTRIGGEG